MCWLKLELGKSCKAKSWMWGSADNWALLLFILSAKHLWLRCTTMLCSLLLRSKTERIGLCHTRGPALTCLFALQSAKQISLPLENQVGRTCQRRAAHLKALGDHPQCDKRHETILWPPTTSESHDWSVKWLTVRVSPPRAWGSGHANAFEHSSLGWWMVRLTRFKGPVDREPIWLGHGKSVPLVQLSCFLNHSYPFDL